MKKLFILVLFIFGFCINLGYSESKRKSNGNGLRLKRRSNLLRESSVNSVPHVSSIVTAPTQDDVATAEISSKFYESSTSTMSMDSTDNSVFFFDEKINISSPNYPNNYPRQVMREWILKPIKLESPITIQFNHFYTYDNDYVTIIENEKENRRFSGNLTSPFYVSGHGYMIIWFQTNYYSQTGFHATIYNAEQVFIESGGIEINTVNYPKNYPANLDCEWVLEPITPERPTTIEFKDFRIGLWNYVQILEKSSGRVLKRVYGFYSNFNVSFQGNLIVHFVSNYHYTARGFKANIYNGNLVLCKFAIPVTENRININSPIYPRNFPNNYECEWNLHAQGYIVHIEFNNFYIQNGEDYVTIISKAGSRNISGASNSTFVVSSRGSLRLRYVTNSSNSAPEFNASVYGTGPCYRGCSLDEYSCNCRLDDWRNKEAECIPLKWLCDGFADCKDGSDEVDCYCSDDQFQCSPCHPSKECLNYDRGRRISFDCIATDLVNNGIADCLSEQDGDFRLFYSLDQLCIDGYLKCDGNIDCPHLNPHDEFNCGACPSYRPIPCDCYKQESKCNGRGFVCYPESHRCDKRLDCVDGSDEVGCSCRESEFQCQCYKNNPVTCKTFNSWPNRFVGCIPLSKYHDGKKDCDDGSDETQFENMVQCGNYSVTIRRLSHLNDCNEVDFPSCNISTCYHVPSLNCNDTDCNITDVICTSNHSCNQTQIRKHAFQCNEGSLILANNFCNGKNDCPDFSDESINGPGFKCLGVSGTCYLPQRNLYDNLAQCSDESDLSLTNAFFQCLDKRLIISTRQVCDGIFDCYDLSDECLCQNNTDNKFCNLVFAANNISVLDANIAFTKIHCSTKHNNNYLAALCDGRPECKDFSDECECENPPAFCNDSCHDIYLMGDRYCDGHEDEAWKFINKSTCPKGFDEMKCPKRFKCKAGRKVSVDIVKICDGRKDCDQNEDEQDCEHRTIEFPSLEETIANRELTGGN